MTKRWWTVSGLLGGSSRGGSSRGEMPQPTEDELWDLLRRSLVGARIFGSRRSVMLLRILPWSRGLIRRTRWMYVHRAIDLGMVPKVAYLWAAKRVRGTPAECGPDMMRKDYEAEEKSKG
jgi:hypothetical protein